MRIPKREPHRAPKGSKLTLGQAKPRLRPNIAICVINSQNEALLISRSEYRKNDWQFPQGGIEPGENLTQAALRELNEEVGLTRAKVLGVYSKIYTYRWPKKLLALRDGHSADGYVGQEQSLAIVRVNEHRPKLKPDPREAARVMWVPLPQLIKSLHPVRRALGKLAMVELEKLILEPAKLAR